jgi:hypothetical protein
MAFEPENDLERTLMRAAKEPAARPEFYRLLLESDLLVLGTVDGQSCDAVKSATVQPGQHLKIASVEINGRTSYPLFSSLTRLQAYIRTKEDFLSMKGRSLFEGTPGASFVLNPGSDYGKELLPGEVARLLDPNANTPEHITIQKPTRALIGQPSVYPHNLVNALKGEFEKRSDILAAYLVQIAFEGKTEPPHPLIGVEVTGNWNAVSAEIGRIARIVMPGALIDVAPVDRAKNDTMTASLLKTEPFYVRSGNLH